MYEVKKFIVGELETNTYLLSDIKNGEAILVDPGAVSPELDEAIANIPEDKLKYILLTHGHFDHIAAAKHYKDISSAKIAISSKDKDFISDSTLNMNRNFNVTVEIFTPDILLDDGDVLDFSADKIKVLETSGHTAGSLCFILGNELFTGDTLFKDAMGRTDLPTGANRTILRSLKSIYQLEGDYNVYPGHGELTTLERERQENRYMKYANEKF